jgi:hypothetical protein
LLPAVGEYPRFVIEKFDRLAVGAHHDAESRHVYGKESDVRQSR